MSDNNKDLREIMGLTQSLNSSQAEAMKLATRVSDGGAAKGLEQISGGAINTLTRLAEMEAGLGRAWHSDMPEELAAPLNAQLMRSARTAMALADAAGIGAEGKVLGAVRGLIEAMPPQWRVFAIEDARGMSASWSNELSGMKNKALIEMGQEPEVAPQASGPEPSAQGIGFQKINAGEPGGSMPPIDFANFFVLGNLQVFHARGAQAWPSQPEPRVIDGKFEESEMASNGFEQMLTSAAKLAVGVKSRELESGKSFDQQRQELPRFYQTMMDIEASHAALAVSMHATAFDKEPDGASVGAMKGLLTLMSPEAKKAVVSRGVLMPTVAWMEVSAQARREVEFESKMGALRPANPVPAVDLAKPAPSVAALDAPAFEASEVSVSAPASGRIEPTLSQERADAPQTMMAFIAERDEGRPARSFSAFPMLAKEAAPPQPADSFDSASEKAPAAIDYEGLGFKAGRMLSGFVNEWSPAAVSQKISSSIGGARAKAESAILGVNASVDRATGFVAAPLMGAKEAVGQKAVAVKEAAGQKAAAVKEGLGEWAHHKAESLAGWADSKLEKASGFVGAVGELSQASVSNAKTLAGQAALGVKGRLPSEEALNSASAVEKQKKAVKWASIGGALLVGVAMAPVAGVIFAAVGGWAAYTGFDKGLAKGTEMVRGAASSLPEKLDNLASRLGARRAQAQKTEPSMEARSPKP